MPSTRPTAHPADASVAVTLAPDAPEAKAPPPPLASLAESPFVDLASPLTARDVVRVRERERERERV
jgi:hypothetical protein